MVNKNPDFAYSADFLNKLNTLRVEEKLLCNSFFYGDYNLWYFYQQLLFEEIKAWSVNKKYAEGTRIKIQTRIKNFFAQSFLILSSCTALLICILFRKKVIVYSVDRANSSYGGDFRLEMLYKFLVSKKIPFTEFFHTVPGKEMLTRVISRKRFGMYLEAGNALYNLFHFFGSPHPSIDLQKINFSVFETADEKVFARQIVERYSRRIAVSTFNVNLIKKILRATSIKAVFGIDDARFFYEVILGCTLAGVPTFMLQHGHFTKYHVGWLRQEYFKGKVAEPTAFIVTTEYWKRELLRLGSAFSEESIIIGGMKNEVYETLLEKKEKIVLLIPYETVAPKEEVTAYIKELLLCTDIRIIFKLRPDIPAEVQMTEYGLTPDMHPNFSHTVDTEKIIEKVNMVGGVYSTFLYETILKEKNVIIFDTSSDYYAEGMLINGLATLLRKKDLCEEIKKIHDTSSEVLKQRREKFAPDKTPLLENTLLDIASKYGIV